MGAFVRLEVDDGVGVVRLDRPPANAIGRQVGEELLQAIREADAAAGVGAIGGSWTQLVARMRQIDPAIKDTNVQVEYRGSGVGFAGDPTGMDIVPIVTVQLTGMTFRPLTLLSIKVMDMPDFHSSLTAEDSIGTQSN